MRCVCRLPRRALMYPATQQFIYRLVKQSPLTSYKVGQVMRTDKLHCDVFTASEYAEKKINRIYSVKPEGKYAD